MQTVRSIERTCHHRCNGHLVQFLQAFDQEVASMKKGAAVSVLPGQLTLASAFAGAAKCYERTHPKQVKISSSIVKNLVVGCGGGTWRHLCATNCWKLKKIFPRHFSIKGSTCANTTSTTGATRKEAKTNAVQAPSTYLSTKIYRTRNCCLLSF